ncbi:MAG: efflux RND transporter periplasmic adaptor subunit [Haliea sp.]|nr:efflux RND transporter periplasmic adaptor subunit [Haliea sp.]
MDKPRTQGRQPGRRLQFAILVATLCAIAWFFLSTDLATRRVDSDSLRIGTVTRQDLAIEVNANGVLLPREVEWIAAQVEGRVYAIHRRAGEEVKDGEVLVTLSNPELINSAEEARSALQGGRAALVSYEVDLQNLLLDQQAATLRAKFAHASAVLKLDAETRLRETSSIIPDIDYQRTLLEVEQLRASHAIEQQRAMQQETNIKTQLAARTAQVEQLARAVERAQAKVDALTVRAGMNGVVQQMGLEIGQRLLPGAQVARIARQGELYAELKVLAQQATHVASGQAVTIDTRNGVVTGRVSRVDPAVNEGTVVVDVALSGDLPPGTRPELQVQGLITVAQLHDALIVDKPAYGRADGQLTLYRLLPGREIAERTVVQTGRASVNQIEIVGGLEAGDRIILSDTSDWQDQSRIHID